MNPKHAKIAILVCEVIGPHSTSHDTGDTTKTGHRVFLLTIYPMRPTITSIVLIIYCHDLAYACKQQPIIAKYKHTHNK